MTYIFKKKCINTCNMSTNLQTKGDELPEYPELPDYLELRLSNRMKNIL